MSVDSEAGQGVEQPDLELGVDFAVQAVEEKRQKRQGCGRASGNNNLKHVQCGSADVHVRMQHQRARGEHRARGERRFRIEA